VGQPLRSRGGEAHIHALACAEESPLLARLQAPRRRCARARRAAGAL